ncbi:protein lifeguard 1 [Ctenopharyngodon idella]|uniref:protein lifeguard 1 n=1 Tax=Ctenopharyngodon idella TaxID=7959 RepID=UPI002231C7B0|nr:protein lifeguard 1 [Ctenopharyngodon idella]XP_051726085.1 protein lifeguard 1 [Ctenopharyngodon idella]
MTDVEIQKTQGDSMTQSDPSHAMTAPMHDPPPYMPPPYPTGPAMYPQPVPAQAGFIQPDLPPEEAGVIKTEPNLADDEEHQMFVSSFEEDKVQKAFIRKVFSVITIQLLVTFTVVCVFTFSKTVKAAVRHNIWAYLSSYIIFLVVALCLSISTKFSRSHPWNLIGLSVITLSLSYMVGTVASYHNTDAVIIALGSTLVISFTIIIFSAQTRLDFTICNGILLVLSVNFLMFGFFTIFFYTNVLQVFYGFLGALLYAMFLAVDCQLVMGRKKYSLSPEEYVFAALIIYLDIILIFLYILMILSGGSKS